MIWFFGKKKGKDEEKAVAAQPEAPASSVSPSITPATATPVQVTASEKKYVVRYEWKKCIGSAVCEAVAPAHFKVENGKATLLGSKLVDDNEKVYEKEISEQELDANKMAADGCPPNCIRVINLQTGEEIAPKK